MKKQGAVRHKLKQVKHRKANQAEHEAALKQEALDFQTALVTIGRFTVKKQIGEDEVLFGTVTNGDVAEVIQEATKKEIDRRNITVPDIHSTGKFKVQVKLHAEVTAEVNLDFLFAPLFL